MIWRASRGSGNILSPLQGVLSFELNLLTQNVEPKTQNLLKLDIPDIAPPKPCLPLDDPEAPFGTLGLRLGRAVGDDIQLVIRATLLVGELEEVIGELGAAVVHQRALARRAAKRPR